jgi:hypothetical protein
VLRWPFGCRSPAGDLGVALSDGLGERGGAVDHASTVEGGVRDEARTFAGHVDDATGVDAESGFAECGVELSRSSSAAWGDALPAGRRAVGGNDMLTVLVWLRQQHSVGRRHRQGTGPHVGGLPARPIRPGLPG